ncbi:MAG TPA: F0F1 ATP synthase subunit A [Ktedonobacteraceae bacterium]|nr:F0F1 ATP synthase subunit A [Ktedonobacteraceae bacterium]
MLWRLPEVTLAPDVIFTIPGINFPVTNTLLCTWLSIVVLVLVFYFATRRSDLIPRGFQNFMEWVIELLRGLVEGVSGREMGRKFFPLVTTFFLFILVSNVLDVFPGVDTVGAINTAGIQAMHTSSRPVLGFLLFGDISNQIIPWIRPATTDLNLNIAMALIAVITAQVFGFVTLGTGAHLSKYFKFKSLFTKGGFIGVVEVFQGLLEIISEIARIISLAFRLFGNIFAGTIVLAVFAFIIPFVADIIFIPFELFVCAVQAFVFGLLALIYLQLAVTGHDEPHEAEETREHTEEVRSIEQKEAITTP